MLAKQFREDGIPDATSDATFTRARRATCAAMTPFGPVVQPVELPLDSGATTTHIQHPLAMMYHACREGGAFPAFMRDIHARRPCTDDNAWQFVFYYDGVGMKLLDTDARHVEACYWSIAEFGRPTLNCEAGWFVIGAPRQSLIEDLPGGMSHYAAILMRTIFGSDLDFDVVRGGVQLPFGQNGSEVLVFIKLHIVVADEVALKALFHFRGASARLPCSLCVNATALRGNVPRGPFS